MEQNEILRKMYEKEESNLKKEMETGTLEHIKKGFKNKDASVNFVNCMIDKLNELEKVVQYVKR